MARDIIPCKLVSVWNDNAIRISADAKYDRSSGEVVEVEHVDFPYETLCNLDTLGDQFIEFTQTDDHGAHIHRYDVKLLGNKLLALRPYSVFFTLRGYTQVYAESREEATRLANECRHDDISWDDDWEVDVVQLDD